MKNLKIFYIILFLSFLCKLSFAQELVVTNDVGAWLSAGVEKKFYKKFKLDFSQQLRLFHDFTKIDDIISNLAVSYRINENFSIALGARYTKDYDYLGSFQHNIRYNSDFSYRYRISQYFRINYRLRFQKEFLNLFNISDIDNPYEMKFRHRIKCEYLHNQAHNFYFSGEIFRSHKVFREAYFSKYRLFVGDKINFGKQSIDISLGFQSDLNKKHPMNFGIIAVKYAFAWK